MRPSSFFEIAPGLTGFRTVMVNFFLVVPLHAPRQWVLVDAGLRGSAPRIVREAALRFGSDQPPQAILLTHGHFDHIGALPSLLNRWNVPVYAHPAELPFLNQQTRYPAPDPTVGGGLMSVSSPLYPRQPPRLPTPVHPLPSDGTVPGLPEWKWIPTPGHTPGHVSFWRESDRVLITGDALVSTRQESALAVWRQHIEVRPPPAYFTPDWRTAYDSMRRLRALDPAIAATGHGLPLRRDHWLQELDTLLADFDRRGLPRQGRYVTRTWPRPALA